MDVNDNLIQFEGKTVTKVGTDGKQKQLEILVTTKKKPATGFRPGEKLGIRPDIITLKTKFKNSSTKTTP